MQNTEVNVPTDLDRTLSKMSKENSSFLLREESLVFKIYNS